MKLRWPERNKLGENLVLVRNPAKDVLPAVHAVMRLAVHHRRAGCVSKADLQFLLAGSQHEDFLRWFLETKRWFSSVGAIELNDLQLALEHFYGDLTGVCTTSKHDVISF